MKILYMMHIPWKWIKQRPHYFAEMLNEHYDTMVLCKEPFKRRTKHIIGDESSIANKFYAIPFYKLPIINKIKFLNKINSFFIKDRVENIENYKIIFITSWTLYYYIQYLISPNKVVIYDAMDDDVEFPFFKNDKRSLEVFYIMEKKLIDRANVIFCSSEYLKNKILSRTGTNKDITVINNAYSPIQNFSSLEDSIKNKLNSLENIIMYIGVISSWFDFSAIKALVNSNLDVNIVLFGPLEIDVYEHPRVHYLGVLKRDMIFEAMSYSKILVMPFIVNELIRSVNPVKVYEYIATNKHIILSYYEETSKFSNFVNYYNNDKEFVRVANSLLSAPSLTQDLVNERKKYISKNSWELRFQIIKKTIDAEIC